ncbi:MAG TPA: DUF87 domain-containing protein [Acidimicrobiia bacterium]|nr:DUF87 domain-containing protein [Acidimicrobiia bacterium]
MAKTNLYLGGLLDLESKELTSDRLHMAADELTTHGVIVGMTGSGKTGLGIIFLEEALRSGIPTLILDPKGDMTNLLLTFPRLAKEDFEPWIDETEARRQGKDVGQAALEASQRWRDGLASWDLSGDDIAALRNRCDMTIYTPGSTAGVPLDVLGSLTPPPGVEEIDDETLRDEIAGLVSGILSLVGVDADLMSDREPILLSNLIETSWRAGESLTLEDLIARVDTPPMRKMGVFDIDTFFPPKDRRALAMRLNNLVASPSFSAWRSGTPLDAEHMLRTPDGKPRAAIVYMAHLGDDERQFVVSTVLSRFITWMRRQSGTSELRALIYMDEVFGFVPPTANPPAKKPILSLFKSARAFGVGMLLATQNPVDLDYKAMSNAGAWCVGRLQTERDKARIIEALRSASGEADVASLDTTISGLAQRQFLMYRAKANTPSLFTTRWAMSYLRGPLTRDQVAVLMGGADRGATDLAAPEPTTSAGDDDTTPLAPSVAAGTPVSYLSPAAPWSTQVGAKPGGTRFGAAVAARVMLSYSDTAAKIRHRSEWEAVFHPLTDPFDPGAAIIVDHDDRDFLPDPPDGATYVLPAVDLSKPAYLSKLQKELTEHLHFTESLTVFHNPELKVYSRVNETREQFVARCHEEALGRADAEAAKKVAGFERKIATARTRMQRAGDAVRKAELDADLRRREEMVSGAEAVLGVLIGRRSGTRVTGAANRRSRTQRAEQAAETARNRVETAAAQILDLEEERDRTIVELRAEWDAKADWIDERTVSAGKTTTVVQDLRVVWIPIG